MYIGYYKSLLGLIKVTADEDALLSCHFIDNKDQEENKNRITEETIRQLNEYFEGTRLEFDLPLKMEGTAFQIKVWNELQKIPFGATCTYKDIALNIDNPKAVRAVGNANNKNKIAIIIPCHRVIGCNNKMVGYAGGIFRKQILLDHEKSVIEQL